MRSIIKYFAPIAILLAAIFVGSLPIEFGAEAEAQVAGNYPTRSGLGDGSVAESHLSGALSASLVHYNDAGLIPGYITGTSAITTNCYNDGGLTDGASCLPMVGKLAWSPTAFYISPDDAGASSIKANPPPSVTRSLAASVATTGGTATQCVDFEIREASAAHAQITVVSTQMDGGTVLLVGRYQRVGTFRRQDGGVAQLISGGFETIGTDREDDTSWGGVAAPTFDGGVVAVNVSGAANQPIEHNCFVELQEAPRTGTNVLRVAY